MQPEANQADECVAEHSESAFLESVGAAGISPERRTRTHSFACVFFLHAAVLIWLACWGNWRSPAPDPITTPPVLEVVPRQPDSQIPPPQSKAAHEQPASPMFQAPPSAARPAEEASQTAPPRRIADDRGFDSDPEPPESNSPAPIRFSERTAKDISTARSRLNSTNDRPSVQVTYEARDIQLLVQQGRGVIVASSLGGKHPPLELCLRTPLDQSALNFIESAALAERLASFGISLAKSGPFARVSEAAQPYFGSGPFAIQFIPEPVLAEEIFAEVSRAIRGIPVNSTTLHPNPPIVEGRLVLTGNGPSFMVTSVRLSNQLQGVRRNE